MPDLVPVDKHVRERIRTDLDTTFFVEAGAGTGKTTSLVSRVVALVRAGIPATNIAAITFTEMAAAELIDKVRQQIDVEATDETTPPAERDRLQQASLELDSAPMQTVHAFARRILASFPIEAELPPRFDVVDETSALLAFDERWERFLDDFLGEGGPVDELEYLYAAGLRTDGLKPLARNLHDNWDRVPANASPAHAGNFDEAPLLDLRRELSGLLEDCRNHSDRLFQRITAILDETADVESSPLRAWRIRLWAKPWPRGRIGAAPNWTRAIAGIRELLADLDDSRQAHLEQHSARCLQVVLHHLGEFVCAYADERRAAGRLQYHDLLVRARDLLRASPEARRAMHRRFPRILIDEFQDTDPLQVEIAALIARDPDIDPGVPWDQSPPPPGSIFVVGDPKQSIYRFRRADVELYAKARDGLGGERLGLVQNFRSMPPIIDWVNRAFKQLMPGSGDAGQASYEALAGSKPESTAAAAVFHVGGERPGKADEVRDEEAATIARVVNDLCAREILIATEQGLRPIRRSDVAVLFRSRTVVPALEFAFEDAEVPYRVESQSLIYASQEASDLYAVLCAFVDPSDEVALVAALRSPAFACSDVELYRYKAAGGRWDYLRTAVGIDGPVADALQWLRDHRAAALTAPINVTVETLFTSRRMFESASVLRRPRQRWQRYRFLLEQARMFASDASADLRQFVAWLKSQRDGDARAVETASPESDDDAVRFLTIHSSKGLEFPVVILAGLASGRSNDRPSLLFTGHGLEASLGAAGTGIRTAGYEVANQRDDELDDYEAVRCLYVAATRARDMFVVSLFRAKSQKSDVLNTLLAACPTDSTGVWRPYPEIARLAPHDPWPEPPAPTQSLADLDAWRLRRGLQLQQHSTGNAIAATALAHLVVGFDPPEVRAPTDESRPWRRGRAGTNIGRAVHAVLQVVDLATGDGVDAAAHVQAGAEGVSDREHEVAALARAALSAVAVREALASGRWWREVFVSAPLEERLLEGFIDLAYERDDGLVVVDYKTDTLPDDAAVDAAVTRYRLQVAAYALALEANVGKRVVECRLVFLSGTRALERVIGDLPAAYEAVRLALRTGGAQSSTAGSVSMTPSR